MNVDDLYNDLICLCEIQGQLDDESNASVDARIAALRNQIAELEGECEI